jgi:hypothetical protein
LKQVLFPTQVKGLDLKDYDAKKAHIQTPEGDGRMNHHITACITTRGDGKFIFILNVFILN